VVDDVAIKVAAQSLPRTVLLFWMAQGELFKVERLQVPAHISGFSLHRDYVSAETERDLMAHADAETWQTDFRRRIQQYGLGYASGSKSPTWVRDFSEWLLPLAQRVAADAPLERFPENCVINEYIPPLGIGPHLDYAAFGPTIACVSLGSDIVIDFTHPKRGQHVPVFVPARSFWVITGEARSAWTHGIATRLSDHIEGERRRRERRISITFRTARNPRLLEGRD
jgi:alkylated DNA repair dioxygenase AlkB